jgi:2-polyprenyl-6-methoxyphenol hydroxylase-like FAD-dependent oxidoreductase
MMRILISGGGIAGLTLAYWLHRYGFVLAVIEQAEGIRRDGCSTYQCNMPST